MKCAEHATDGCAACRPALRAAWSVGQLREALAAVPGDTPPVVNAVDTTGPAIADEQVVVGAGFGVVNWGDGYGLEPDILFGLDCEMPEALLRSKPDRPRRRTGTE